MANADPVAAIAEADATGEIAALYADIRASLGVPVVNLIWRHLATFPGALSWAWESLKPLYGSNAIRAEATALRMQLTIPDGVALGTTALAGAELSTGDLTRITMILRSYERSNAMNLVALGTLFARLNGVSATKGENAPLMKDEDAIDGEMPTLLTLGAMAPEVRGLVEDLNRIGGRDEILPTMYRHLAHWPSFLALIHGLIAPLEAQGRLRPIINDVITDGRLRAARMAGGLANPILALEPVSEDAIRAALEQFIQGPLSKMVAIVALIRAAMPSEVVRA